MTVIAPFYEGWRLANERLTAAIAPLSDDDLRTEIRPDWPIWASASHIAGARVYWLCAVAKEPGIETTPFPDPESGGWEDDLSHPRGARELVGALASSWAIVERCLRTWTTDMLTDDIRRTRGTRVQLHTRQSIIWRLITHDAFHAGEISLALGAHGLGSGSANGALDLWGGLGRDVS